MEGSEGEAKQNKTMVIASQNNDAYWDDEMVEQKNPKPILINQHFGGFSIQSTPNTSFKKIQMARHAEFWAVNDGNLTLEIVNNREL